MTPLVELPAQPRGVAWPTESWSHATRAAARRGRVRASCRCAVFADGRAGRDLRTADREERRARLRAIRRRREQFLPAVFVVDGEERHAGAGRHSGAAGPHRRERTGGGAGVATRRRSASRHHARSVAEDAQRPAVRRRLRGRRRLRRDPDVELRRPLRHGRVRRRHAAGARARARSSRIRAAPRTSSAGFCATSSAVRRKCSRSCATNCSSRSACARRCRSSTTRAPSSARLICLATPQDFARFGYLYLRDGVWDGRRILPEGWVDYARTQSHATDVEAYGAHWWLTPGKSRFHAGGYDGQRIQVVPEQDIVLVRCGRTPAAEAPFLWKQTDSMLELL